MLVSLGFASISYRSFSRCVRVSKFPKAPNIKSGVAYAIEGIDYVNPDFPTRPRGLPFGTKGSGSSAGIARFPPSL